VVIQPLTQQLAKSFNYPKEHGILVADVTANSPAEKAGLKDGDILVAMNGQELTDISVFRNQVAQTAPGTQVKLEVWRDGKSQEVTVTVEQMPASFGVAGTSMPIANLGLTLATPTPSLAHQYHLTPDAAGALVVNVTPGSTADRAGLQAGDLIVRVQGTAVHDADQAQGLLTSASLKEGVRLRVRHAGMTRYVFLKVQD
jgi:serine protease Do